MTNQELRRILLNSARSLWDKDGIASQYICDNIVEVNRSMSTSTHQEHKASLENIEDQLLSHTRTEINGMWSVENMQIKEENTDLSEYEYICLGEYRNLFWEGCRFDTKEFRERVRAKRNEIWDNLIALNEDGSFDEE